ncbi:MAG: TetR/AcrR family transcriptional regulator [Burkholderiales bacterium]|nr:TetR/AcrR family transcriptional regulator [Burkholderiales bacterium]
MFHEVGYELASMSTIAARAGSSKTTLYSYFPSKTDLFVVAIQCIAEREFRALQTTLQTGQDVGTVLYEYGKRYLRAVLSPTNLSMRRMVQHEAGRTDVGALVYEHGLKACWTAMADYLQSAMNREQLRAADPWASAMHLRALYEAELVEFHLLGISQQVGEQVFAEVMQRAVNAFMAGYGPDASAGAGQKRHQPTN